MTAYHLLAKPTGAICNLDCDYCFFLSKEELYPGSTFRMSEETLSEYLRQYLESQIGPDIQIAWQGGEPTLMGLEFFRRSVALAEKHRRVGTRVTYSIQTNGTLLDDEWCRFLRQHRVLVGLSLDGPRDLHDAYRHDKGGHPTFDKVMRALRLLQAHEVDVNVLTSVHAANAEHPLEVYRFLRDEAGVRFIQTIPIVERDDSAPHDGSRVTSRSVTGAQYGEFLTAIFDEWVERDVGEVFVQMFDVALASWFGEPHGLCVHSETCGAALAMEHNGDLYSCDHFVEAEHLLGNIHRRHMSSLASSEAQMAFGRAKRESLPRQCRQCDVRFACHGGCPKDRILESADGEPGLNYLCDGYLRFFRHVRPAMERMCALLRAGRAPAEIVSERSLGEPRE
ncbi:Putative arylsulfatase regulatory protein [Sandaracinus amylolyticus]|uniref:Putative arylsulfatase regulatory protein n=2 Tax=Sandaracinus amylolyticus TaxID=927083 RepID=A0A0F6SGG5_9BACT|nr:Putative arylsulfatase regulatory protein [Sandaracinus amylolyticus]